MSGVSQTPKTCDLCGGGSFEEIAKFDRRGKPLDTVACTKCGLVAHARIPSEEELNAYYSQDYRKDYHGETTPSARRVLRAWRKGKRLADKLKGKIEPGSKVFEVGAGIGCNVKALEFEGFDSSGIEPNKEFERFSREQLRTDIRQGSVFDLEDKPTYDFVLLIHVIEHFRSPREALEKIHNIMKPGGRLYLECPSLHHRHADRSQIFHFAHIHNFNWQTLESIAAVAGFELKERMCREGQTVLQGVFTKSKRRPSALPKNGLDYTHSILADCCKPDYRIQAPYLVERFKKLRKFAGEFLTGRYQVARLIRQCQAHAEAKTQIKRAA